MTKVNEEERSNEEEEDEDVGEKYTEKVIRKLIKWMETEERQR